jgi:hypothetical protein
MMGTWNFVWIIALAGLVVPTWAAADNDAKPAFHWCPAGDCDLRAALQKPLGRAPLHLVYFRSDVCPACVTLEANITQAGLTLLESWAADPGVELLVVDLSAPQEEFDTATFALVDRGLAKIYNGYLGITGLIAIAPSGSPAPVACLNLRHDADAMKYVVSELSERLRSGETLATGDDLFCPPFQRR